MSWCAEPEFFGGLVEEIILRESYQVPSIQALKENIRQARKAGAGRIAQVLSCPTGSGKTTMAAYLLRECWQKEKRGIFVVDRNALLAQTSRTLDKYGIPHGVIGGKHPRYRPTELIQVVSIHTVAKRGWPEGELIVVDECHIRIATTIKKIERRDAEVIGLTATPFAKGMGKLYSHLVNVTTGNKLTAEGYLVPFKVWAAKEPNMDGAKVTAGEWSDETARERTMPIVGDVVKEYQEKGDSKKAVCFAVDTIHCEELQRQFLNAGISARLYTYHEADEEKEDVLREFAKPDSSIRILISVAALSRGFDCPDVEVLLMCRPLRKSFTEFVQVLGRVLRPSPETGKRFAKILDLAGNFLRHYPALLEFMEDGAQSLDDGKPKPKKPAITEEKKPRKCSRCGYLPLVGTCCPACGHMMAVKSAVKHEQGSLGEFDGAAVVKYDREMKRQLFAELSYIQADRRYAHGWIAHKYRAITKVWPTGMADVLPVRPSDATLALVLRMHRAGAKTRSRSILAQSKAVLAADLFG